MQACQTVRLRTLLVQCREAQAHVPVDITVKDTNCEGCEGSEDNVEQSHVKVIVAA
jgi:hypothetical protein